MPKSNSSTPLNLPFISVFLAFSSVLAFVNSPGEHDGHIVGSPEDDDEGPDSKMLKSVHGEIPKQSAPLPKEELEKSACKSLT